MSFIDNIRKDLFNRVSRSSNIKTSVVKYNSYTSLFQRNDKTVPYKVGMSILRDTQVSTGAEIIKYLLSSKQWILTDTTEEESTVYDFIYTMLIEMETELNTRSEERRVGKEC